MVSTGEPIAARELGAALDPGARLVVEPVDAHERAARPGDGRLGGQRDRARRRAGAAHGRRRRARARRRRRCAGASGTARARATVAAVEPVGELVRLGRGLEQRDGGGASRHSAGPPRRADAAVKRSRARPADPPRSSRPRPAGSSPPGVSIAHVGAEPPRRTSSRGVAAAAVATPLRERRTGSRPSARRRSSASSAVDEVVDVDEVAGARGSPGIDDRPARRARARRTRRSRPVAPSHATWPGPNTDVRRTTAARARVKAAGLLAEALGEPRRRRAAGSSRRAHGRRVDERGAVLEAAVEQVERSCRRSRARRAPGPRARARGRERPRSAGPRRGRRPGSRAAGSPASTSTRPAPRDAARGACRGG